MKTRKKKKKRALRLKRPAEPKVTMLPAKLYPRKAGPLPPWGRIRMPSEDD